MTRVLKKNLKFGETPHGKFYYWNEDWLGTRIGKGEIWDGCLLPWMNALRPGQVMVDVGAHIGLFTIYLGNRGVRVHSFEAAPELFELLKMNISINGLEKTVTAYNVALYEEEIDLTVSREDPYLKLEDGWVDYDSQPCSGWLCLAPANGSEFRMRAKTLDSFGLANVALLKVDTEGCDLNVLRGARRMIEKYRPVVCYEFNEKPAAVNGCLPGSLDSFMEEVGYRIKRVSPDNDFVGTFR